MYVSLPTLDLRKIQDDIRLSPIGLQSIVFNYARLIEGENGTHDLIWSRSKPQAA